MQQSVNNGSFENTTTWVSLEEACASIAYYKQIMVTVLGLQPQDILKAFTVHHEDIFECLGIPDSTPCDFTHFRVYFGMQIPPNNGGPSDMRLFLVPVRAEDTGVVDVIPTCPVSKEFPSGQYVYDFNTPCPNTCDITSPLFLA
jgi:hypothetical protein